LKRATWQKPSTLLINLNEIVIELYPLKDGSNIENSRLDFSLDTEDILTFLDEVGIDIISEYEFSNRFIAVVADPDGRRLGLECM